MNNDPARHPAQIVNAKKDSITVQGVPLPSLPRRVVFAMNKPKGYLCSHVRETKQKRLVFDLLPSEERIFSVGRLDCMSTGLLLITNDGELAYRIMHPSHGVEKEYIVDAFHPIEERQIHSLRTGTPSPQGYLKPIRVTRLSPRRLSIVIREGKNREIRILCAGAKIRLSSLHRIRIGRLRLSDLRLGSGHSVQLTPRHLPLVDPIG